MTTNKDRGGHTPPIVERLRDEADCERDWASEQDYWHEEILREAADTITALLEALEQADRESAQFTLSGETREQMRRAIAKAKGQSSPSPRSQP